MRAPAPKPQRSAAVGVRQIIDVADPSNPEQVVDYACPGSQHDVSVWQNLLFVSVETPRTSPACDSTAQPSGTPGFEGIRIFDVSNPRSSWKVPRIQEKLTPEQAQDPNCTMHNFNTLPTDKGDVVVSSAYAAGTTMVDFTNASEPREVGHLDPHGANTWSAYWYNGHIYTNDGGRGVDVLKVSDRATKGARNLPFSNPQTIMFAAG